MARQVFLSVSNRGKRGDLSRESARGSAKAVRLTRRFRLEVALFVVLTIILSLALSSAAIYLTADQEFTKSFFSAHRDLLRIWSKLLPTVAIITAASALVAVLAALVGLSLFRRSLERSGMEIMASLEALAAGRINAAADPAHGHHVEPLAEAARNSIDALRQHVDEVKNTSVELHRTVMRLNYLALEEGQVTMNDLKTLSANLNTLSRELSNSLKWFET